MAIIATFGNIPFSVSDKQIKTLNNIKWSSKANYSSTKIHLGIEKLQFTGTDADSISFEIYLSAFCGVDPLKEIEKFLKILRNGVAERLIIGQKAYGRHKWVIESQNTDLDQISIKGKIIAAKINLSLKEYVR